MFRGHSPPGSPASVVPARPSSASACYLTGDGLDVVRWGLIRLRPSTERWPFPSPLVPPSDASRQLGTRAPCHLEDHPSAHLRERRQGCLGLFRRSSILRVPPRDSSLFPDQEDVGDQDERVLESASPRRSLPGGVAVRAADADLLDVTLKSGEAGTPPR